MGNLMTTLKKFLTNKNTVTILAVIAGIIVLWYFYNMRLNQAIKTVSVPYAVKAIDTSKKIETDNIEYRKITASAIKDNDIITNVSELQNMYICPGTSIPANGFFHASQICEAKELPNSVFDNIPDNYTIFNLKVNNEMTYANSIMPGTDIDLFVEAIDDNRDVVFARLIEKINVLAVRDSSGKDVFWDSTAGDSAYLLFAVPDEYHRLLEVAELIPSNSIKIVPVPRSASYTSEEGETKISSVQLKTFIESKASTLGYDGNLEQ